MDLNYVIKAHNSENRNVQNFLGFMEWKFMKSDTPDLLCSAEFRFYNKEESKVKKEVAKEAER